LLKVNHHQALALVVDSLEAAASVVEALVAEAMVSKIVIFITIFLKIETKTSKT
jgi:hypothetical protein